MRYAIARYQSQQRDLAYRIYVTECSRITTENTAKTVAILSHGEIESSYMPLAFNDILNNKPKEEKTEKQIIDEMQAEFIRLGFETN
jgi:hypothetical protein